MPPRQYNKEILPEIAKAFEDAIKIMEEKERKEKEKKQRDLEYQNRILNTPMEF